MKTHPMARLLARHLRRMGREVRPDDILIQRVEDVDGLVTITAFIKESIWHDDDLIPEVKMEPYVLNFRIEETRGFDK